MWIATGFHAGDINLARALFQWCHQLDSRLSHGALLVCDPAVDWSDASDVLNLAAQVFQRVEMAVADTSVQGWPIGANTLFRTAAQWFESRRIGPWLWCEPDAVPIRKGWLDALEADCSAKGKPFMGTLMTAKEPNLPKHYLPGIAVYPYDAWTRIAPAWRDDVAFDVATAPATVPFAADTNLLQHFWGQRDLPPTFVEATPEFPVNDFTVPNRNKLTLANIRPEAVLFHRCKDKSLLNLLGYREPKPTGINIDVVLPFYAGDARLMLKNLQWMSFLHDKKGATVVLLADTSVDAGTTQQIIQAAQPVFGDVTVHRYSSVGFSGWPHGPNRAFQEACMFMAGRSGNPGWFWMEADAVPIVPDWLEQLSADYERAGKPFGGTVIDFMGHHLNGVSIYPASVQHYCKSLMKIKEAWDVALNHEITPHRHRMNHLIQHCMTPPSFASAPDLRAIDPGVVVFHPAKGPNLIDRLAEQMTK